MFAYSGVNNCYSSHPDQGVTVTLRSAIPISPGETPNALKLRFLSALALKTCRIWWGSDL